VQGSVAVIPTVRVPAPTRARTADSRPTNPRHVYSATSLIATWLLAPSFVIHTR
jgi:hypothetical protein